ncbi:MAG: type I secretion protein, partial [Gemmobacter sp.]
MPVFAHYNLNDLGTTAHDSALGNGAQDGYYLNGAASDGERAVLDGQDDVVKILRDDVFQMDRGTLDIKFTIGHESEGTETIISRDSTGTTDGGFRMERLEDGTLRITHESGEGG